MRIWSCYVTQLTNNVTFLMSCDHNRLAKVANDEAAMGNISEVDRQYLTVTGQRAVFSATQNPDSVIEVVNGKVTRYL